jgi:hypothetical protein
MRLNYILLLVLSFVACTSEEELFLYETSLLNESASTIRIIGYRQADQAEQFNYEVTSFDILSECYYTSPSFLGLRCSVDSVVIRFDGTNRGYINTFPLQNNFSFPNKSLFSPGDWNPNSSTSFSFVITEEDRLNAFDLP